MRSRRPFHEGRAYVRYALQTPEGYAEKLNYMRPEGPEPGLWFENSVAFLE